MAERAHPEDPGFQDRWFGLKKNKYRQKLFERYQFCNAHIRDRVVLDVPCGTGWGTSLLEGYQRAHGVDIAEDAVAYAKQHYERPGVLEFQVGGMDAIPLDDDSIEAVLCLEGFEHVSQDIGRGFLEEAQRLMKRGGILIMTCPVLNDEGKDTGNPHHIYEYPEEELVSILNERFRIEELTRIRGPEGPEYRTVVSNLKGRRYLK